MTGNVEEVNSVKIICRVRAKREARHIRYSLGNQKNARFIFNFTSARKSVAASLQGYLGLVPPLVRTVFYFLLADGGEAASLFSISD